MDEAVAQVYAELKLATDNAKEALKQFAAEASGTEVKVKAKPDEKSLNKFAEAFTGKNTGSKGSQAVEQALKGITGGMEGLMGALKSLGGALGTVAIAITAVLLLMKGTDTLTAILQSLANIFDTVQEALAPVIALLGDILIPVLDLISRILKPIAEVVAAVLAPVLEVVALLVDIIIKLLEPALVYLEGLAEILKPIFELARLVSIPLMLLSAVLQALEPLVNLLSQAFQTLADVIDMLVGWIFDALGISRQVDTITTGTKQKGTNSSLDAWEVSKDDQVVKNTDQTVSELKNVITELKSQGKTEQEIKDSLGELYGLTEQQVDALLKQIDQAQRPQGIFGGVNASKDLGFGGGLFTDKGRWGDGYQFGDVTGSVVDFGLGLVGKGWLWKDGGTLPTYDGGGTVGAQIWGMNESGNPEFLFNSGGYDSIINANALEDAMYNALKRANKGKDVIELKVNGAGADARQLVRWLMPALKLEWGK